MFNRPECTQRVFAEIRKAHPEKLYLIADGPRPHKKGESDLCDQTRKIVEDMIDWPCKVHKDYAKTNMGCGTRIISGLNAAFNAEEELIILEDDILPDPSFIPFCEAMLDRYRNVNHIVQISGYAPFRYKPRGSDYLFTHYSGIWGWATWRRAWSIMERLDESVWSEIKQNGRMKDFCLSSIETELRTSELDDIFSGKVNNWDAKWVLARNMQRGLGVVPRCTLTKNIGFSTRSTHTLNPLNPHRFARLQTITPPFQGPQNLLVDENYDRISNKRIYSRYAIIRTKVWKLARSQSQKKGAEHKNITDSTYLR